MKITDWFPWLLLAVIQFGCVQYDGPITRKPPIDAMSPETTTNTIAWGKPHKQLCAGLQVMPSGKLGLFLENRGTDTITVMSHVTAQERHYDWFRIHTQSAADGSITEFLLLDSRDRSATVQSAIAPGEKLQHDIDFADWSHRRGTGLVMGAYSIWFSYSAKEGGAWRGKLESGRVSVVADEAGALRLP